MQATLLIQRWDQGKTIYFSKGERVGTATIDQDSQKTNLKNNFTTICCTCTPTPKKSYFEERGILEEEEAKTENL